MTTTAQPPQAPTAHPAAPGTAPHKRPAFVIISQVYVPDPAAVGQYQADAAAEMARRGYRTIVYTARNGYDDPSREYPARELKNGVEIRRLPFSSFGKDSIKHRLLAQVIFLLQAMVHALFTRRLCGLMVSTSPPDELRAMGQRAGQAVAQGMSKAELMGRFCDVLQQGLPAGGVHSGRAGLTAAAQ